MTEYILILNVGSSSIKFALYPKLEDKAAVLSGSIRDIARLPVFRVKEARTIKIFDTITPTDDESILIGRLLGWINNTIGADQLIAVDHRLVNGGSHYGSPILIDQEGMRNLEALTLLAPHHQSGNLTGANAITASHPNFPQVTCFDSLSTDQ